MDIFNLNSDDFISQSAKKVKATDENLYDPDVTSAKNGVYKAVLRFIPWFGAKNVDEIRYKKYMVKLRNPLTKEFLFIDDPSTIGLSSVFWNLETRINKLKKEEPGLYEEMKLSENFSRFYKFYSLVYIKKDMVNPDLEGKIKVFPYGFKIWKMGEDLINPQDAELGTATKVNPFDMVNGRDFIFVASKKNTKFRDFDSCKFVDKNSPLVVKTPKGVEVECSSDPVVQEKFRDFLIKNSPDLSKYFFKQWAEEDYAKVVSFLKAAIPSKQILDEAFNVCRDQKIKDIYLNSYSANSGSISASTAVNVPASSLSDLEDDLNFNSSKASKASSDLDDLDFGAPSTTSTATKATASAADDDMWADL